MGDVDVIDAQALELAHRVDTVAFDKTGTLTVGRPRLVAFVAAPGFDEAAQLAVAASLQGGSEHPLARAVEAALIGQPWGEATLAAARDAMALDYQPMTDMRASASYRLIIAQNMLTRYAHDLAGTPVSVLEVQP